MKYAVTAQVAEYFRIPATTCLRPDELVHMITGHIRDKHACDWLDEACRIWDKFVPIQVSRIPHNSMVPTYNQIRDWMMDCQCIHDINKYFTMAGPEPFLTIYPIHPLRETDDVQLGNAPA
jgi:hypothetical protein